VRRAEGAQEHLDGPAAPADREASLRDLERLNAWFGGYALTLAAVDRLVGRAAGDRPLTVVDVGGGRGDLAHRIDAWARRRRRAARVVVVDRDRELLARTRRPGRPVLAVQADATALPLRPGSVDVVVAGLLLHHLEPPAAVRALAGMGAAARLGVIVNDLLRSPISLALVWLVTRLCARHPFSRADGPLSVRRAYRPDEIRRLARQAGMTRVSIRRYPPLGRLVAVATR
jgi:2-polyprenyl-3-methyl-5-hydroxy-6-metoxy-1,4-benzoquinol methylase